jgi:predicted transcriptional regulator
MHHYVIDGGKQKMRRSKMEMYIDILKVMARNGPLKLTHVMYKANVNCRVLKEQLDFLLKQNLIEEQIIIKRRNKKKIRYAITERGRIIIKYFNEVDVALQLTEEGNQIPMILH